MNENELAEQRRSITRSILVVQAKLAASKHTFFNGGAETSMAIRSAWDLELAELELQRHDVEALQNKAVRARKQARAVGVHGILVRILQENKLDRYVMQAVAECDEQMEEAHV